VRAPVVIVVLVLAGAIAGPREARADSFAELAGGIAIPAGDSDWTNLVGTSPKLAARAGAMSGDAEGVVGAMLGVDWTPEDLNNGGGSFGFGSTDGSVQRFRVIASGVIHHRVSPKLTISGRAGAGIDIAHASIDVDVLGSTSSNSATDVGYAFEFGVGAWYDLGGKQVGLELAVPIGHHDKAVQKSGDIPFQYTSVDIDLMLGIRL
jgi:hypothetical protein